MSATTIRAYLADGSYLIVDSISGAISNKPANKRVMYYTGHRTFLTEGHGRKQGIYENSSATAEVRLHSVDTVQYGPDIHRYRIEVKAKRFGDVDAFITQICEGKVLPTRPFDEYQIEPEPKTLEPNTDRAS